ncbi:MAG: isoquinoline 1-oxidoreductase beta subunit [Gemmatimonadetes bacterium]|nr:isoquinoline 1-oxidoreductase beta subunit [Gemmatimonadota bacterium]
MLELNVNQATVSVDERFEKTPLLWALRDVLGLRGTKFGCGAGFCAACTVLIDGKATKSCQVPVGRAVGKAIVTVEGISGAAVDAVRTAWYTGNVVQCGYCQPGQTLAATSLLTANPAPDDEAINEAMNGNLCRCGTYPRIRSAIHHASGILANGTSSALPQVNESPVPPLLDSELGDPVHPYIKITAHGRVLVRSSQIEMGQGINTGLTTLIAEELDVAPEVVQVTQASGGATEAGPVYGNLMMANLTQLTGGSTSTQTFWARYRAVAAMARARLLAAASERLGVPVGELHVDVGIISAPDGRHVSFGDVAQRAEQMPVPTGTAPKEPSQYRLIGHSDLRRVESAAKILGKTHYTIDIAPPHVRTAVVLHAPRFGAKVLTVDDKAALSLPGVVAVVPISNGIGVVGETFDDAQRGLRALTVTWDDASAETRSSEQLAAEHRRILESGDGMLVARDQGDVTVELARAAYSVDAVYEQPFLAHAAMEPNNAVCQMREDGRLDVWASTQGPEYTAMAASVASGLPRDRIDVHVTLAGGAFGLHSSHGSDPSSEAVEIARAMRWEHAIKVQSLREEDFKSGRFRPMSAQRVRAGTDAQGAVTAFHHELAAKPTGSELPIVSNILVQNGVDFLTVTGAVDPPYAIPNMRVRVANVTHGVPVMTMRSVGNSPSEFARESAVDELALAANMDPVAIRRRMLSDNPRTLQALNMVADIIGWRPDTARGRGIGFACSDGLKSHSAAAVEVTVDAQQRIHVERVVFALDCGIKLTPDLVRAQVEGGILFGLSAALWGEIILGDGGEIVTRNFDRYQLMRMRTTPTIDVHLIESTEEPGGVGEVSVPLVAPAVANAVFNLTGVRIRRLPINKTLRVH